MVEAGATLSGAFVEAQLVDEMYWYIAPCLMGQAARSGMLLPEILDMSAVQRWMLDEQSQIGPDWRFKLKPIDQLGK